MNALFAGTDADGDEHSHFLNGVGLRLPGGGCYVWPDAFRHVRRATEADEARLKAELSGEVGVQRFHAEVIVLKAEWL